MFYTETSVGKGKLLIKKENVCVENTKKPCGKPQGLNFLSMVRLVGIEPTRLPPEGSALSTELQAQLLRTKIIIS